MLQSPKRLSQVQLSGMGQDMCGIAMNHRDGTSLPSRSPFRTSHKPLQ